jgi:hypothetical protein
MKRGRRLASLDGFLLNLWIFLFVSEVASGQPCQSSKSLEAIEATA